MQRLDHAGLIGENGSGPAAAAHKPRSAQPYRRSCNRAPMERGAKRRQDYSLGCSGPGNVKSRRVALKARDIVALISARNFGKLKQRRTIIPCALSLER